LNIQIDFVRTCSWKLAAWIVKILAKTKITPNQITVSRILFLTPLIAFFFARGSYFDNLLAIFLYFLFLVFDSVDGRLARLKSMESEQGAFMEDFGDRMTIIIALASVGFGSSRRSGSLLPFFLVFFLLILDNLHQLIAFKWHQFGVQVNREERKKLGKEFRKKGVHWREKLFFKLIYLPESPLLFVFARMYPFILGILLDQLPVAFFYMLVSGFIYLITTVYICADFTRKTPNLLVVRRIKKINQS